MLEDSELDFPEESPPPEPKRAGNRGFLVAAGTLGAIMLLAMVGIAYYALVILPEQQAAEPPPLSAAEMTGTAVALALQATNTSTNTITSTSTNTTTNTPTATRTSTSTLTPITPLFTETFTASPNGATQTVNALLTQAAVAQTQAAGTGAASATQGTPGTPTSTPSALPDSGFADNIGAPGLLAAAAALLLIIFIARRLRANT
jgi:cytoskeletal protein RodZ